MPYKKTKEISFYVIFRFQSLKQSQDLPWDNAGIRHRRCNRNGTWELTACVV